MMRQSKKKKRSKKNKKEEDKIGKEKTIQERAGDRRRRNRPIKVTKRNMEEGKRVKEKTTKETRRFKEKKEGYKTDEEESERRQK